MKKNKRKIGIVIVAIVLLCSILKIGITYASTDLLKIKSVDITSKSPTVEINNVVYKNNKIVKNVIFHKVEDNITYKIKIKNNSNMDYTIKAISNDNENKYISYEYKDYEGTKLGKNDEMEFIITEKYTQEVMDVSQRNQFVTVNFKFLLEDENGNIVENKILVDNSINPQTGDVVVRYYIIAIIALMKYLTTTSQKRKYYVCGTKGKHSGKGFKIFSLLLITTLILPSISKAATNQIPIMVLENSFSLEDKLVVTYEANGNKRETIVKYNEKIENIEAPEKDGYMFKGWKLEDGTFFDLNIPITEDVKIIADFEPIRYKISYELDGGTVLDNPTEYSIESEDITLNNPTKNNYIFTGWTGSNLDNKTENVTILKGSSGEKVYNANYTPIDYIITYEGLTEEEEAILNNPTSFNVETNSIKLRNPENRKDSDGDITQIFVGWREDASVSINITIPEELENKVFEAVWETANPNIYTIIYDLNNGTILNENPNSFTKYDETFKLNNPTRKGYKFDGWTGSNGTIPQTDVTVQQGTRQNLEYIANWTPIEYTISYELNGGVATNQTTYTVEDEIILNKPTKMGYDFNGWTGTDLAGKTIDVTIPKGSTGNRQYSANYSPKQNTPYTIIHKTMNMDGESYSVRDRESLEGETNSTIIPETKVYEGFTAPDKTQLTITANGTASLEYKYTRNKYMLTIEDEEDVETTTQTGEYYYETEINLKAKRKTGYTFNKWSNDETDNEISLIITEDFTIEPIYSANLYTISFDAKGGSSVEDITQYYDEEIGELPITTKSDFIFDGWYADEEYSTIVSTTTKVTGDSTFYAKWRNPYNYTISFNANGGEVDTDSKNVIEGNTIGNLPTPTKTDYIFEGWYTDSTYTTEITENTIPTEDTTYYAKWKYKFITVFSFDGEIIFNGEDQNIEFSEDANFERVIINNGQRQVQKIQGLPTEFNKGTYVDTNISLFSEQNYSKDFEIGFEIVEYDYSVQQAQATFVNEKYELESLKYPGFVFRRYNSTNKLEFTSRKATGWPSVTFAKDTVQKVKIIRKNNILYYSINDGQLTQMQDLTGISEFETTVTFGASLQINGEPFRFLKGTLKNLYIILEE